MRTRTRREKKGIDVKELTKYHTTNMYENHFEIELASGVSFKPGDKLEIRIEDTRGGVRTTLTKISFESEVVSHG